jgi:hypothetical protein
MKLTAFRFVLIIVAGIALGGIMTNWEEYFQRRKALTDASGVEKIVNSFHRVSADSSTVKFRLLFRNNPLEFDDTYTMWVALNHVLIYEGPYSDRCEVVVPESFINKGMRPYLLIKKGNKVFDGWKKERICFFLNTEPVAVNFLNVYFSPEFTAPGNYIMFSGVLAQ